jgi:hypothetical protein
MEVKKGAPKQIKILVSKTQLAVGNNLHSLSQRQKSKNGIISSKVAYLSARSSCKKERS